MAENTSSPAVKKNKVRKTVVSAPSMETTATASSFKNSFDALLRQILESKTAYENLEREIAEIKQLWVREQKEHEAMLAQAAQQEEIVRKREAETRAYETELAHKKAEDLFKDKISVWEKELAERKDKILKENKEFEDLHRQAAEFPAEKDKAVKDACVVLQKELSEKTATENRLREQEFKAQQEVLNLKIVNLTENNTRLSKETEKLKQSLEDATRQLKEVALKVIESGGTINPNTS